MDSLKSVLGINYTDLYEFICSTKGLLFITGVFVAVTIFNKFFLKTGSVRQTWNKGYDFIVGEYICISKQSMEGALVDKGLHRLETSLCLIL